MRPHLALIILATTAFATAGLASERVPLQERYAEEVEKIREAASTNEVAYSRLQSLCDDIGHRISGSPQLERAIDWAEGLMREDGLVVRTESVQVPKWVRGEESARVVVPYEKDLEILGLGMTVAGDVKAEVVAVSSWEELEALDDSAIAGRIVLFDVPFTGYGATVQYRGKGPVEAARRGAVGMLIRSVTPVSLNTPHTGATRYDEEVPKIPAAALTIEDAAWIHRLLDAGSTVEVELKLSGDHQGMVTSRNLIGEIPGRELPEEIVVVGCHIDSWDVGQGAQDDGAGCLIAWESVRLLHELEMVPRRTVRVVLFTNEENGLGGGRAYAETHADEVHQALFESDTGNGLADGFRLDTSGLSDANAYRTQGLVLELANLIDGRIVLGYAGADIGPRAHGEPGAPALGMNHDTTTYWPIHHTEADTFDKVVKEDLQANIGTMAAAVWVLAEMEEPLVLPEKKRGRR